MLIAACTCSILLGVLLITSLLKCGSLSKDSLSSLKHLCNTYLHCTHCIIPESLLNHLNSFCGGMFKLHAKFDADLLLYLLNHFECDGHTVHMFSHPHWLVYWSHHFSCVNIPSYCPWLPGYMDMAQTVFVILTMAGLFLDRSSHVCWF